MWYVYIIECQDGKLYTGLTNNVERRLQEHKHKGSHFTREPVREPLTSFGFGTVQPSTRTKFGAGFVPYQSEAFGSGGFAPRRNPVKEEATAVKPWSFTSKSRKKPDI